jgi:hypothetical protein
VLERQGGDDPWTHTVLTSGGVVRMPEIGVEIPVAEICRDMAFPEQPEAMV